MTTVQQPAENLGLVRPVARKPRPGRWVSIRMTGWTPTRRSGGWRSTGRTSCRPSRRRACGRWPAGQLVNPMNIMLLIVVAASFAIVQIATAVVVLGLVTFNVVMGTAQELKARASVEALAKLQVPHARVRRSGQVERDRIDHAGAG